MTSAQLVTCPSCARHVRVSEASCPFCATSLPEGLGRVEKRRAPSVRLSRAALYAFGAGTVAVAAACSSSSTPTVNEDSGTHDAHDEFRVLPAYGLAVPDAGDRDVVTTADGGEPGDAEPDVTILPAYGLAIDSGEPGDATFNRDAVVAAYGGPGV